MTFYNYNGVVVVVGLINLLFAYDVGGE